MKPYNPAIPPDYCLLKLDEREHWHEKIQAQTRTIFGVYAFDRSCHTHLCEATPSYELRFVANDYEEIDGLDEEARERLNETILCADSEPVTYMHARDVDALIARCPERCRPVEVDVAIFGTEEAVFDAIMDDWNTGTIFF
jgi:hypothetical protein